MNKQNIDTFQGVKKLPNSILADKAHTAHRARTHAPPPPLPLPIFILDFFPSTRSLSFIHRSPRQPTSTHTHTHTGWAKSFSSLARLELAGKGSDACAHAEKNSSYLYGAATAAKSISRANNHGRGKKRDEFPWLKLDFYFTAAHAARLSARLLRLERPIRGGVILHP